MTDGAKTVNRLSPDTIARIADSGQSRIMRAALFILLLAGLGACVPLSTYYRPGASVALLDRDETACEVDALREAPVATQTRFEPPRYYPSRRYCDSAGNCTTYPGFWEPGETYVVDLNAQLRQKLERLCMADKGYVPVKIPVCPAGVAQNAPPGRTTILPPLNERSCVIRNRDGSVQIVTRG